jgi:polygalacturonase
MQKRLGSVIVLAGLFAIVATAQDKRTVAEPVVPKVCAVLYASFAAANGVLPEKIDEQAANSADNGTATIQKAIDRCRRTEGGKAAVELSAAGNQNAFLTGPIALKSGVTLMVDKGVTVFGSVNPRDYDYAERPGICGTSGPKARGGCKALITIEDAPHTGVYGPGTIDGRGGVPMIGSNKSCWQVAREAEGPPMIPHSCPRLIVANHADDLTLYNITLKNSPNFHVAVNKTNGFTAWGVRIDTPVDARNTDGIDPGDSDNITITRCWIHTGDDNVAIKSGGNGTHHLSITHNHFYAGHGISIGSGTYEGVSDMLVDDLVMIGTANGVRIKSDVTRGGLVSNITYSNICMKDVQAPIAISPNYNDTTVDPFEPTRFEGTKIPNYKNIVLWNIHVTTPGSVLLSGWDDAHSTGVTLDGVAMDGLKPADIHMRFADVTVGPNGVSFVPAGKGVKVTGKPGKAIAPDCTGRFVDFPKE